MQTLTAYKKEDFRAWLKKHAKAETRMAVLIYKKHTGKPSPTHKELMFEAICFGWIDTTIKRLDEDRYLRNFARRSKNSKWSDNTLRYAKALAKAGRMTPEGMRFYREGLNKPTHHQGIPDDPAMPPALKAALKKDRKARENFEGFPPSAKRAYFRWLLRAKLAATRTKRVKVILAAAKANRKNVFAPQPQTTSRPKTS